MGFFQKIFRRKSSGDGSPTGTFVSGGGGGDGGPSSSSSTIPTTTAGPTTRRGRRQAKKQQQQQNPQHSLDKMVSGSSSLRDDSPTQILTDEGGNNNNNGFVFQNNSKNSNSTATNQNNSNSNYTTNTNPLARGGGSRGPDLSDGTQRPILSPRVITPTSYASAATDTHSSSNITPLATSNNSSNYNYNNNNNKNQLVHPALPKVSSPVDLDDINDDEDESVKMDNNEEKKMDAEYGKVSYAISDDLQQQQQPPPPKGPIFAMTDDSAAVTKSAASLQSKLRFSAGNMSVEDDTDGESSSFNLSTDAEDTEYEAMRRRLGAAMPPPMDLSVTNYTTDGETSVFQGLPSEDDATMTTVSKEASQNSILQLPTVNPATGASLIPVGGPYGMYDNRYAMTAAADAKSPSSSLLMEESSARFALPDDSRFVQQQKQKRHTPTAYQQQALPSSALAEANPRYIKTQQPQQQHNQSDDMRFSLPNDSRISKPDDIRYSSKPLSGATDRLFGSSLKASIEDNLDDKIDIPLRAQITSNASTSHIAGSKNESPERIRASKTPLATNSNASARNFPQYSATFMDAVYGSPVDKPVPAHQPRRSFTSTTKNWQQPSTTSTATFEPFATEPQPLESGASFTVGNNDEDLFSGFADFSNFDNAFATPAPAPFAEKPHVTNMNSSLEIDEKPLSANRMAHQSVGISSPSTSAIHNETSLSELLAKAKSKSSSRNGSNPKKTSTSVSSAPAMTASFLRQHHNLGSDRTKHDGASVTDIIHSLEAAQVSRAIGSSTRSLGGSRHGRTNSRDDGLSTHSKDASSLPSSKDKIRRRRERRHQRNAGDQSSESEDEYEDNESWLFDEVTGALGPRGIAADLESLSGRSNRSSSSRGNRSHKSHRSHKSSSRTSRRRHKSGSGESVESRHSRDSRRSRGSRYSHRSTRSYISQMSEQSRSVANDLLRLEMQLAMVGSGGPAAATGADDRSASGRSRVARTAVAATGTTPSSSRRPVTARRSRITVHAPPGKLGIILANKVDSRGTVVSGVRTTSVLAETISPGDRIVAIDGEDVSLMTVSEITTIMTRNAEFDRTLTVLTTPRHTETVSSNMNTSSNGNVGSPRSASEQHQPHRYGYRN